MTVASEKICQQKTYKPRRCVDCGYKLTEYYRPTATRCARCHSLKRGLVCRICKTNKAMALGHYCPACDVGRARAYAESGKRKADSLLNEAIRKKLLPRAKTLHCVDCASPAHGYDHRDYSKPLDVVPVCRSCNSKRGRADNVVALMKKYCAVAA